MKRAVSFEGLIVQDSGVEECVCVGGVRFRSTRFAVFGRIRARQNHNPRDRRPILLTGATSHTCNVFSLCFIVRNIRKRVHACSATPPTTVACTCLGRELLNVAVFKFNLRDTVFFLCRVAR